MDRSGLATEPSRDAVCRAVTGSRQSKRLIRRISIPACMSCEALLLQLPRTRFVRQNISTNDIPFPIAETILTGQLRANSSSGHLSVHVEGAHPADVTFLTTP